MICAETVAAGAVAVVGWKLWWSRIHIWLYRRNDVAGGNYR